MQTIDIEALAIDMLNDCYDEVRIGNLSYQAGYALAKLDPVALREVANDYLDSLMSDGEVVEIDNDYYWTRDVE